jgi:hypothetical protein
MELCVDLLLELENMMNIARITKRFCNSNSKEQHENLLLHGV